jgi:CBS domain containing-hemolysin-like protein
MTLLILFVAFALIVSFLCSIMEAVLLSVTPSYVAALEGDHPTVARRLRQLKEDVDRPLAAILTLNTMANTVGAAGAGAQVARVFGSAYLAVFTAGLTLAILFLSEIIPKTLGAVYWRPLAPATVTLLRIIIPVLWPLVALARRLTRLISRGKRGMAVQRDEFTALAELGAKEGVFRAEESRVLKNLFRLGSLRTKHIMTPRIVVFAVPERQTVGEVLREHSEFRFSRIPVYGEDLDDVTGYVLKDDLLLCGARDQHDRQMREIRREILVIPETLSLSQLLERFLDSREHIALVVDEYGGTAGVVAMEDVVETVLGLEIVDEADKHKDMQELAREQWLRRAKRLGLVGEDFVEGRTPG